MIMKNYSINKCPAGSRLWIMACIGLLLPFGCTEDPAGPDRDDLTGEPVVVDFTLSETSTRSVSHEALPAHERIKSLTYLLYDSEGSLLKHREIPGISDMGQGDWPMKRSTMTWAQREALKDTLVQGRSYTAVFVANADKSLFGGEEVLHFAETVDGEETSVALDEVYLSLPATTAFGDGNMFYLCVKQITPDAYDRDNHCDCPVTLQRIVCRTDFFSDDYPGWDTDFTKGKIRDFTDSKVYGVLMTIEDGNKMPLGLSDYLEDFISKFYSFATSKGYWVNSGFTDWYNSFKTAVNGLDYSTFITNMPETDKESVRTLLYNDCRERLKSLWLPWKGLQAKVAYSSRADRFYVSGLAAKVGDAAAAAAESPFLDVIQKETGSTDGTVVTQNTFTLIGFGENASTAAGSELNRMTQLRLYESAAATDPVAVIPMTSDVQSFAAQGGNERVQLLYCPIRALTYNSTCTTGRTYTLEVDIMNGIVSAMGGSYASHSDKLASFFADDSGSKFGTALDAFKLQITLPDLSGASALTVTSQWSVQ